MRPPPEFTCLCKVASVIIDFFHDYNIFEFCILLGSTILCREISVARVFLNYSELFTVNVIFWRRAIQPLLECSRFGPLVIYCLLHYAAYIFEFYCEMQEIPFRQSRKPFDPVVLLNGFEDISEWSKCYIPFNLGHDDSHTYVQKKQKDNEMFREFVQVRTKSFIAPFFACHPIT